ncbi:hypothetical protein Q4604_05790 [Marinovum sp. 1_MG-2023]|nr:hypothetical protein [Marinovum sp. 1_MG-2023]
MIRFGADVVPYRRDRRLCAKGFMPCLKKDNDQNGFARRTGKGAPKTIMRLRKKLQAQFIV